MAKTPKWMHEPLSTHLTNRKQVLMEVARVLAADAASNYRNGNHDAHRALKHAEAGLKSVANGATYADAFNLTGNKKTE